MSKRDKVIKFFLDTLNELQEGNKNIKMYKKHFESLTDSAFHDLMVALQNGTVVLPYYAANLVDKDLEIPKMISVGRKLGVNFFERVWLVDPVTKVKYLTPEKYPIVTLSVRRQSQHVTKGKSVAESSMFIDSMTGQPTGNSQVSRMSLPEINNLASLGLHKAIEELITVRGGNVKGFLFAKRAMLDTGEYTLKSVEDLGHKVTSTETLKSFLLGCHFESTF